MNQKTKIWKQRKIIHIDMDSFFASIEIRDNPNLQNKPVAVGGKANERGVLTTCNYLARKYGLHSAMSSKTATQLCKELIILPVDITKYRKISKEIFKIFKCYSRKIEPVSIDEAFLDVSESGYCQGDPEEMAKQIRSCIKADFGITASAGISSNKLIAKICSDWKKPDNQFSICDDEIQNFIKTVSLKSIPGIGKVNFKKCKTLNMTSCSDMQKISKDELIRIFGSYGYTLFNLVRGIDNREIETNRTRKSISVEDTFLHDLNDTTLCIQQLSILYTKLIERCKSSNVNTNDVREIFLKIKFNDFETITRQKKSLKIELNEFKNLFDSNIVKIVKPIRLLGIGFRLNDKKEEPSQYDIFDR
jgi:DNA polymerase-4